MKRLIYLSLLLCLFQNVKCETLTLNKLTEELGKNRCLAGKVTYEVYLPSQADPVVYTINLIVGKEKDPYCECSYLIDWTLPRGQNNSYGFNAYDGNGNHFRYRDTRLQEFHVMEDSIPFISSAGGVARTAQFTELLPIFVNKRIIELINDSTVNYSYNEQNGIFSGIQQINGYDSFEFTYHFDIETGLPDIFDFIYNPGGISEQTVSAHFDWEKIDIDCVEIDEDFLINNFKDVFEKYRISNFKVENLRGTQIPNFTYRNSENASRMYHNRGEADLINLTLIAFVDTEVENTNNYIESIENAIAFSGRPITIIYAFYNENLSNLKDNSETRNIIDNPGKLIRNCGINAYPTLLVINKDGNIEDIIVGDFKDDSSFSQSLMVY